MIRTNNDILNAFTVDVEDYFHVQAFADRIDPKKWDDYESRVIPNTRKVLRILDERQVRGTFFILGWVADRFPDLVQEIHEAGHEIGCHGFWHKLIYEMSPEEFREDLLQASKAIEEVTQERVTAFRAPSFSITKKSLWALDILIEEGFQYDSSIFPVYHDKYGIPDAPRFPHRIDHGKRSLLEFPPTVYRIWKYNLPIAG
ncbi:MAG: polysaccharide deacetylase family protein, partial [Planctomycetota bacterium]